MNCIMNKRGFTLIELMVAMFMASIVSLALFTALSQSLNIQKIVDDFLYLTAHEYMIHNQLSIDLMGAFVPIKGEKAAQSHNSSKKSQNSSAQPTPTKSAQGSAPEKKEKPLEKVFLGTEKKSMFDTLTFITRNPLIIYWSESSGHAKAKRARVIYRLEIEEGEKEESYKLTRQEGAELVAKKYDSKETNARKQTVATGIKSMQLSYLFSFSQEDQEKKKETQHNAKEAEKTSQKSNPRSKITFKTINHWNSDDNNQYKETKTAIPDFVQITTELWDKQRKKSRTITTTVPLVSIKENQKNVPSLTTPEQNQSALPNTAKEQTTPVKRQQTFGPTTPQTTNTEAQYIGTIDLTQLDELPKLPTGAIDWHTLLGSYS